MAFWIRWTGWKKKTLTPETWSGGWKNNLRKETSWFFSFFFVIFLFFFQLKICFKNILKKKLKNFLFRFVRMQKEKEKYECKNFDFSAFNDKKWVSNEIFQSFSFEILTIFKFFIVVFFKTCEQFGVGLLLFKRKHTQQFDNCCHFADRHWRRCRRFSISVPSKSIAR